MVSSPIFTLKRFLSKIPRNRSGVTTQTTLVDAFEKQYRPKRLIGCSSNTIRQYHYQFAHLRRYLGREPLIGDLTDENLSGVMEAVVAKGRRPTTANKIRNHILAMWRYFHGRGVIRLAPDVAAMPEPQMTPRAWSREDLALLMTSCRAQKGAYTWTNDEGRECSIAKADWWVAIHEVLWSTGERIGAIMQVTWDDVDLADGWLVVRAEVRKFRKEPRTYKLTPEAVAALEQIREPERELVFHWPRIYTHLWYVYRKIRADVGLPTSRMDGFHKMRRSVASYGAEAGVDPCFLMGHSSRRVTERSYLDTRIATVPQAADSLFKLTSPSSESNDTQVN